MAHREYAVGLPQLAPARDGRWPRSRRDQPLSLATRVRFSIDRLKSRTNTARNTASNGDSRPRAARSGPSSAAPSLSGPIAVSRKSSTAAPHEGQAGGGEGEGDALAGRPGEEPLLDGEDLQGDLARGPDAVGWVGRPAAGDGRGARCRARGLGGQELEGAGGRDWEDRFGDDAVGGGVAEREIARGRGGTTCGGHRDFFEGGQARGGATWLPGNGAARSWPWTALGVHARRCEAPPRRSPRDPRAGRGRVSAARAEKTPAPACLKWSSLTVATAYGYNHVVEIENTCDKAAACVVSTDVAPDPIEATRAGEGEGRAGHLPGLAFVRVQGEGGVLAPVSREQLSGPARRRIPSASAGGMRRGPPVRRRRSPRAARRPVPAPGRSQAHMPSWWMDRGGSPPSGTSSRGGPTTGGRAKETCTLDPGAIWTVRMIG